MLSRLVAHHQLSEYLCHGIVFGENDYVSTENYMLGMVSLFEVSRAKDVRYGVSQNNMTKDRQTNDSPKTSNFSIRVSRGRLRHG